MDDIDEDSLNREPVADEVAQPEKRRGRPPGYPKTGGRIRGKIPGQKYNDAEAHAVLGSMMPDVVAFHYAVMKGETKATFSGPTGRPVERLPNLPERQKSADWLTENFWRLDEKLKAVEAALELTEPEQSPAFDAEAVRKAMLEDLMARMPPPTTPPPVIDGIAPQADPASVVSSLPLDTPIEHGLPDYLSKRDVEAEPRPGDRIELGEGFFAIFNYQDGTGRPIWHCYPPDTSAGWAAIKPTFEAARKWFRECTIVGQELAKAGGA